MVKSPLSPLEYPEISFNQYIFPLWKQWASTVDPVAMINGTTGDKFTYSDLLDNIKKIASGLRRLGLQKGDIVCIFSPNCPEWVFMFFAILANGASATLINPAYTVYELTNALKDSQASFIFTIDSLEGIVKKAQKKHGHVKKVVILGEGHRSGYGCVGYEELLADDGSSYPEDVIINPKEDVAAIPYSSGTTGLPKGVMLTHFNILANLHQIRHPDYQVPGMVDPTHQAAVSYLPFFHVSGLFATMIAPLAAGSKIITLPRFVPEQFLSLCEKHKVTMMFLVPPVVLLLNKSRLLDKYDLSSVSVLTSGGAPLDSETEKELGQSFRGARIKQGYGMTEVTCLAARFLPNSPIKLGSCGVPNPNTEIQIVDLENGRVLEANKNGEVWIRGPQIMKGYLNNPEATANILDKDGWLHTGDIGYFDSDGYLFIVDRLKDLIKYKGFQVAPAELEALLLNHPKVADVGVVGIPDRSAGEVPRAFVVSKPNTEVTEQELKEFVAEHLATFKQLNGGVEFMSMIPRSPSGKILRRKLKEMVNKSHL